jgi:hypothetical protein
LKASAEDGTMIPGVMSLIAKTDADSTMTDAAAAPTRDLASAKVFVFPVMTATSNPITLRRR